MNILLISSTQSYMDALETQTVDSCKSIMEVYMMQLDSQAEMMEWFGGQRAYSVDKKGVWINYDKAK